MIHNRRLLIPVVVLVLASLACRAIIPEKTTTTEPKEATVEVIPAQETQAEATGDSDLAPTKPAQETKAPPTEVPAASEPTPTPRGYYSHPQAGFSLTYPENWFLEEEGDDYVRLIERREGLVFVGIGTAANEGDTLDTIVQSYTDSIFQGSDVEVSEKFDITLANGLVAEAADLTVIESGTEVVYRFAYIEQKGRAYLLLAIGEPDSIKDNEASLEEIYSSVELFAAAPMGIDKTDNLVLLDSDPDAKDLDPALTTSSAADYVGLLFSGLVRLGPDLQIYPDLAESWSISPDGTVYTFVLRDGLKFADGSPLTTEDVIFSWERLATQTTRSTTAATYMGDILGLKDKLAGKATSIAGLKALDDLRLEVTLDSPKPYFLAKLSYPTSFIVDQATTKTSPRDWVWKANESGPYILKEYTESKTLVLERNPNYYEQPSVQTITFVLDPGGSPISRYEDGTLDILYLAGTTATRVRREDDPLHAEWQSVPSLCTMAIQMNNNIAPFDDPQVRKAFALALDRDGFVERLTNNTDIPALTILPPSMPGFSPDLSAVTYDPAAAKAALQASKYAGNLPAISLEASGLGTEGRDDVNALVETWRQALGVDVEVIYLDQNNFTREALQEDGQMTYYGWCADYPDPQNFLDVLYHTGSEFNVSGYSNPKIDTLLDQANVESDPNKRIQLYQQAEKMLLEDFALIPISYSVYDVVVNPRVKGFVLAPMHASYIPWISLEP